MFDRLPTLSTPKKRLVAVPTTQTHPRSALEVLAGSLPAGDPLFAAQA